MRFVVLGLLGVAVALAMIVSWWAGLAVVVLLPLVPVIADGLVLARVQATLRLDYQYETGANFPTWGTLKGMVRKYGAVRPPLNDADIATMFMAVQINSLARGAPDPEEGRRMLRFAVKVESVAGTLRERGRLSSAQPMEWIEEAMAALRASAGAGDSREIHLEEETAAATRVAQQIAADNASKARLRADMETKPQPSTSAVSSDDIFDRMGALASAWLKNPYRCRTEGMRRVTVALSVVVLVSWWLFLLGFGGVGKEPAWVAVIVFGLYPALVYMAIMTVRAGVLWVIAGFRADEQHRSDPRQ